MNETSHNRKLVVVLGMHRSGTSAISRGLKVVGVGLGDKLMPPLSGVNDKGFWEDLEIVDLNVEMLATLRSDWHYLSAITPEDIENLRAKGYIERAVALLEAKLGQSNVYGFKDPRTSKLLPFWMHVFNEMGILPQFILAIRNPLSVVESISKRDKFDPKKSYLSWLDHVLTCLKQVSHDRVLVVDYDRLIQNPDRQFDRVSRFLGMAVDEHELSHYKTDFLDTNLRHTVFDIGDLQADPNCPALLHDVYTSLLSAADSNALTGGLPTDEQIEGWSNAFDQLQIPLRLIDTQHRELLSMHSNAGVTLVKQQGAQARLKDEIAKLESITQQLRQDLADREESLRHLESLAERQQAENVALLASMQEIYKSNSWRVTSSLRFLARNASRARRAAALAPAAIRQKGGIVSAGTKALAILRKEGLHGVRLRLRVLQTEQNRSLAAQELQRASTDELLFVPLYVDPALDHASEVRVEGITVAVHLYLANVESLPVFTSRMASFQGSFDLFVSLAKPDADGLLENHIARALPLARSIVVEHGVSGDQGIIPFMVQFGERLSNYDVIGHFSLAGYEPDLCVTEEAALDLLVGPIGASSARLAYVLQLLRQDAGLIYPDGLAYPVLDNSFSPMHKRPLAARLLAKHPELSLDAFPIIRSPNGSMFWARGENLRSSFNLPVNSADVVEGSLLLEDNLGYALERLLPILASQGNGRIYRVFKQDSNDDFSEYEVQQDFSSSIVHRDIKVLSYYLPQFHPTPENDEWHGEGFTEWTKVGAAQPLFKNHHQQHIPHSDIGYYLLDSAETLRVQAEQMRKAGVHGQVFYHYWFSGKLILENPAKMLLAAPDVDMPYCFCWANENWTRRWDGNEREILLGQTYSAQDARDFIQYLIPYFRDPRYIRVDGRPMLLVYRPSSIPDSKLYIDVWAEECKKNGLPAPYVTAVLTRGATNPDDFGMDAGTERVLHDWTGGSVENIKSSLTPYRPINGSVLNYDEVADFYTEQTDVPDFTYFRCLVPQWDNTARYGSEALLLHASTPRKFQSWMENLVQYSQRTLPEDRRFIIVNAWNEWAEGAHLEPDSRYGYSYLNSVGRALSEIPYGAPLTADAASKPRVNVSIAQDLQQLLQDSPELARQFNNCLSQARQETYDLIIDDSDRDADFTLYIKRPSLFDGTTIAQMVALAKARPDSAVVPNAYDRNVPVFEVSANGSVNPMAAYSVPMVLVPRNYPYSGYKNVSMAQGAHCFAAYASAEATYGLPEVTTIIRIHPNADFDELRNALYCLAAMRNCVVTPLIAAQDLSDAQKELLSELLADMNDILRASAVVVHYQSPSGQDDLRSKMLNESLRKVQTRYAAFLDYDDLLMPHAYEWLLRRLATTGKAIAFGRVYSTSYNSKTGGFIKRERAFEYGYTYADFLSVNHAPLHSFILDMSQIDCNNVVYHEDQKYMEDYLLTLQLFRENNADWEGLAENMYIGDYIHSVDRNHTLAFSDNYERQALLTNSEYRVAEGRIQEMRRKFLQQA